MKTNERRATKTVNPAPEADDQNSTSAADDFDSRVEGSVSWTIWRAIRAGDFRLAIKCEGGCGRYLTSASSKRRHLGPICAAKLAAEAVTG